MARLDARVVLGRRIRELRLGLDWSQEELAERAGVHRNYVGGVERGERNVGIVNLVGFARALGVEPAELLSGFRRRKR